MTRTSFVLSLAATIAVASPLSAQGGGQSGTENRASAPERVRAVSARQRAEAAARASAQSRNDGRHDRGARVPPGHLPPRGMCRVWLDGVPPGRQASPTSCQAALRERPANARVIYSDGSSYPSADRHRRDRDDRGDRGDRHDDDDGDRRGDWCLDRNHDGRCDGDRGRVYDPRDRTQTLPEMIGTIFLEQNRPTAEQRRWVGEQRVTARFSDADRNRVPERITWFDTADRVVQVWIDSNRDGRADAVELYRDGRRVRTIR